MSRRFTKIKGRKLLKVGAAMLAITLALKIVVSTAPFLTESISKAAIFSAGIAMPEGAAVYFEQGQNEELYDISLSTHEDENTTESEENAPEENNPMEPDISGNSDFSTMPLTAENKSGEIIRKTYYGGGSNDISIGENTYLKNSTSLSAEEILAESYEDPVFKIDKNEEPQVLIYHTHATESYENESRDFFDSAYNARTTDNNFNMVRVGDEIAKQLEAAGIAYIHDTTQHDYPSYNGSYDRSEQTIQSYLEQYPSIKVAIDVHRDAIEEIGVRYAPVADINGKTAAQVMIISGCDDGTLDYPNYKNNLRFSTSLQNQMNSDYPGLVRPILFKYVRYNQHLTDGSILVEVGGHGNSLEEAVYSGELIGKSLANLLSNITN